MFLNYLVRLVSTKHFLYCKNVIYSLLTFLDLALIRCEKFLDLENNTRLEMFRFDVAENF